MAEEKLKVVLEADTSDLEKGMSDAEKAVKEFANEADGAKGKISKFFNDNIKDMEGFKSGIQKAGEVSTNFLKVTGGAIAGVATALTALGPATAEYRGEMAKLESAFETAGASSKTAKETYNDLYRVLGDSGQATEAAGHLAKLTTEQEALSEWTSICQGVYATFGDSLPIEGLTEAANETAKVGQLTGSLADALNWAGVNEEEFQKKLDACNTEAEREALIRETLTGLYDEAATTYEKNAAGLLAQNEANAKMTDAMARLGEAVEPVMTMLAELGAEILTDLAPHIESFANEHLPKIKDALSEVGDKIGTVINWIADNWGLVSTIAGIVIGIATAISLLSAGLTAYNTVMAITSVVSAPMIGIIAAIVAGIALLAAGIVLAVKHWDEITVAIGNFATKAGEFFSGLWENITGWISDISKSISDWWGETTKGFSDWWDGIQKGWSDFWTGVGKKISDGVKAAKDKFEEMKKNVSDKVTQTKETVTTKFQEIKTNIGTKTEEARKTVSDKYEEIRKNVSDKLTKAKDTVSTKFSEIKDKIFTKSSEAFTAVSTKFGEIKDKISTKVGEAFNSVSTKFEDIRKKISDKMQDAKNTVRNVIEAIKGFFDFEFEWPDIPTPHFSISPSGWKAADLLKGTIPRLSINWYAQGGVFDNPTLFGYNGQLGGLGEDGAEAIVPLEKNTYWLDKIATMLVEKQGMQPVILQVDGKVFAQTAINTINDLTRQTGKLNLITL